MVSKELNDTYEQTKAKIKKDGLKAEYVKALVLIAYNAEFEQGESEFAYSVMKNARICCELLIKQETGKSVFDLDEFCYKSKSSVEELDIWYESLKFLAQKGNFDSYMLYLERKRVPKDRFYANRREQLIPIGVVQGLQEMIDDKLDLLTISLPPSTGKTTLEKFFCSFVMGLWPDGYSLFYSHSADITRMFYDGVLDIINNGDEYCWGEIFVQEQITGTNAKMEQINIGKYKPFPSLQCTSVGAKNAGKVRCSKFLLVDDMIGGIEEALNKATLDKLWDNYAVDARQRKTDGCKEIHIATRWSVADIIGRLQRIYDGTRRCKFIAVPDINPKNGKSNFNYKVGGFSVRFFHEQEKIMDKVSYHCLYKNQPIEREGLLYHDDELRRYQTLPMGEPDAILGVCDTKARGTDYMVLPVLYQYGDDYYLVDCVCDDSSNFGRQYDKLAKMILSHNMQQVEFESNAGGDRIAYEVSQRVKAEGGRCNITSRATETNKETRIIVNSDWVKQHILFKDSETYAPRSEYGTFIDFMLTYSIAGKNAHDDVVDAMANFALFVTRQNRIRPTKVITSPL